MKIEAIESAYDSLKDFKDILEEYSFDSIILFSGKNSFENPLIQSELVGEIQKYPHIHLDDFAKNPQIEDVTKLTNQAKEWSSPLYLAIGGGSVIDMAKIVMFFATYNTDPKSYFLSEDKSFSPEVTLPALIAIPTTAGTGSEATQFATLYIDKKKYSLDTSKILPKSVILDPQLSLHLPPLTTAMTGADALSQAIESYWNVNSTEASKTYAKEAIKLIFPSLYEACHTPNLENRKKMLLGSHYAGKAIQITRTTAPHAISYPLTSFFGIPHGQAVAATLPYFLLFNADVTQETTTDTRGAAYVKDTVQDLCLLLNSQNAEEAFQQLESLFDSIGLKTKFEDLGISEKDYPTIIANGFTPSRMKNNPRAVSKTDVIDILQLAQKS